MSETVPGYDTGVWWGLLGPAGMPPDVLAKLSQDFVAALNTDAVKERLAKLGAQPIGSSPQQFDAKIRADYEKWGPIIKAAGMKAGMIDVVPPMIPACLPPRDVTRPNVPLPPDACDTHAHVFGPADRFPYADDRSYTPPDAPLEKYLGMLDTIGFARGVLVQGSAHGRDNSAMLDALKREPDRLRGVAVADADVSPDELRAWNAARRPRLALQSFLSRRAVALSRRRAADAKPRELAPVMAELGWHLQLWIDVKDLPETIPVLKSLRPAGRDRPYGPHRCPRRHRHRRLPEPACARSARAGAGPSCRARIGSARTRLIIPTRGRFMKRW